MAKLLIFLTLILSCSAAKAVVVDGVYYKSIEHWAYKNGYQKKPKNPPIKVEPPKNEEYYRIMNNVAHLKLIHPQDRAYLQDKMTRDRRTRHQDEIEFKGKIHATSQRLQIQ